jgi:hypothetical protein
MELYIPLIYFLATLAEEYCRGQVLRKTVGNNIIIQLLANTGDNPHFITQHNRVETKCEQSVQPAVEFILNTSIQHPRNPASNSGKPSVRTAPLPLSKASAKSASIELNRQLHAKS